MRLETRVLTCLDKVFLDEAPEETTRRFEGFQNERVDFQVAFRAPDARFEPLEMEVLSPLRPRLTVRVAAQVPVRNPIREDAKEDCLRTEPGLYPDLLTALRPHALHAQAVWSCLWLRLEPDNVPPGEYPLVLRFRDKDGNAFDTPEVTLQILPGLLPPQRLIHTKWFHLDGLCQYYHVEPFSEAHWRIIENFLRAAVDGGINMILTPAHTPPLDTRQGGKRLNTQLVDITVTNGEYRFDMSRLRRWIALCKSCGVEYFEMAHLFTQWGAAHAPNIMAHADGEYRQIFGWDTDAAGAEYGRFLQAYIPALQACFREEGIADRVYWHISDEPNRERVAGYAAAKRQVEKLLAGCHVMDALSDFAYYQQGLAEHPIPGIDAMEPFVRARVPGLWTYYCCSQVHKVSNMFIAFPSWRNRILGVQLFKYRIAGFLHWGFNFYNSHLSDYPINPYLTTDADGWVPAGDPFQVYPGEDGMPEESIRMAVTAQALQDLRAMERLAALAGHEYVTRIIDEEAGSPVTFTEYPRNNAYLLNLRRRINQEIVARTRQGG